MYDDYRWIRRGSCREWGEGHQPCDMPRRCSCPCHGLSSRALLRDSPGYKKLIEMLKAEDGD